MKSGRGSAMRAMLSRVLSVTAVGDSLPAARDSAYAVVERISMPGAQHRSDIAAKAVAGEVAVPARS